MLFNDTWSQQGYLVSCMRRGRWQQGGGHWEMGRGKEERGGDGEAGGWEG